ncbi:cyclin-dependent kinases regulatory subunit 1-like [Perognathus longimembris pacificus]|uniref:cyclin-dependent kinases regulatory subunit 1-like n=1 Tax=Perognathus longimembris pacificus TaxID=214514 RepID=UPI002019EE6A|nr:cyclin-dependent kinases regulatory subunit 1-like [Perognathus longimembris pacificus]
MGKWHGYGLNIGRRTHEKKRNLEAVDSKASFYPSSRLYPRIYSISPAYGNKNSSSHQQIYYSVKYDDEEFEYRHVMLPKDIAKLVPKTHLMSESEWRNLGVQQSQGWVHYMIHDPEPHILLFRRPLPNKPKR